MLLYFFIVNTKHSGVNDTYFCRLFKQKYIDRCTIRRIKIYKGGFMERFIVLVLCILRTHNNRKNVSTWRSYMTIFSFYLFFMLWSYHIMMLLNIYLVYVVLLFYYDIMQFVGNTFYLLDWIKLDQIELNWIRLNSIKLN